MSHIPLFIRHFLLALQFFTRIPITGSLGEWLNFDAEKLEESLAHLPAIGLIVGAFCALILTMALHLLPLSSSAAWVAAILSTAFGIWLTGAFHEDGLADLTDGLGGSYDKERALDIMKDSRIGSFGAVALILTLITKISLIALLAQLGWQITALALLLSHAWSRWMPLLITRLLPHVGDTFRSKSKPIAAHIGIQALAVGSFWCLLALGIGYALMPNVHWFAGALGAVFGGGLILRRLQKRLQGFTGDGLGAAQQIGELGFYLALAMSLRWMAV